MTAPHSIFIPTSNCFPCRDLHLLFFSQQSPTANYPLSRRKNNNTFLIPSSRPIEPRGSTQKSARYPYV
jgi:hypothetical protein